MIKKHGAGLDFSAGDWPPEGNKPTLVFIHGAAMQRAFWDAQVSGLADVANTAALDLPGHGGRPSKGETSIAGYARWVFEFIEGLDLPNPVPCGLSMGGAVAQHLLIHHPDRFAAGIIISSGARLKVMPQIFELIQRDYQDFIQMMSTFAVSLANATGDSAAGELRKKIDNACKCETDVALGDFQACNAFDAVDRIGRIRVPVLVVSGGDDRMTPVKYGDYLAQHIPSARHRIIAQAGHLSPLEKPDQVNREIKAFLAAEVIF